jgi:poly(beta-D-mannuronate) lyase
VILTRAEKFANLVFLYGLVVWVVSAGGVSRAAEPLRPPFDVNQRRAFFGTRVDFSLCPSPPSPVRDLTFSGFYADAASSVVDPAAKKAYDHATHLISQYESKLADMSDLYVRADPSQAQIAPCVLDWLHSWAREEAMLGRATEQGRYVRKWGLAPIAASYLKVRTELSLDAKKKGVVEGWIARWASVVKTDYSTGTQRASRQNNHLYWAAWSVILGGIALNDPALYEWARERYLFAMRQIQPDGTLPLELARKSKALHYHVFSTAPLVLVGETLAQNGSDPFSWGDAALHRLVKRTLAGLDDPTYFERLAAAKQDWIGELKGFDFAWMEPYYARFRDATLEKWLQCFRPMKNRRLGGDMTLLFGVTDLPSR